MHCCTGNGTRSIYYLWDHALRYEGGHLRVHLLMNRVSEWADVLSHVPYEGRVDVSVKQPVAVSQCRSVGQAAGGGCQERRSRGRSTAGRGGSRSRSGLR